MDAGSWYQALPRFTRYWLTATVSLSLLCRFGLLPIEQVHLSRELVLSRLQLWRCITSLFVFPLRGATGFHFLINCYFITQYGARLEKDQYARSPSDYLYLLLIISVLGNVGGMLFNVPFLMDMLIVAITYVWCQLNKEVIVNFWFGTRFKAMYLPWVLAGIELVFHGSLASLVGIVNGHIYYFLKFQYPQELGGNAFLQTPGFLQRIAPNIASGVRGFGVPPESRAPPQAPTNFGFGRGMALGRN